jgi:hypothetical protein
MLAGLPQGVRPASLGALIAVSALVGWTLFPTPSWADDSGIALPIYNLPITAQKPTAADRATTPKDADPGRGSAPRLGFELSRSDSSFAMLELPPDAAMPGSYKRPHHAFGYRWQAAESWLHDQGIDAQSCYLPMVRLHSKVSAGGASGTLWLYGRCAFK